MPAAIMTTFGTDGHALEQKPAENQGVTPGATTPTFSQRRARAHCSLGYGATFRPTSVHQRFDPYVVSADMGRRCPSWRDWVMKVTDATDAVPPSLTGSNCCGWPKFRCHSQFSRLTRTRNQFQICGRNNWLCIFLS